MGNRHIVPLSIFISLFLLFVAFDAHSSESYTAPYLDSVYDYVPSHFKPAPPPPKNIDGLRIAVIEQTWYHDEVIGSVLNVLKDVCTNVTFYRHQLVSGFGEVIKDIRDCEAHPPKNVDTFSTDVNEGKYDVVVLVTGDKKFWAWRDKDIEAMNNAKNTHVVAIIHETEWYEGNNENVYGSRLQLTTLAKDGRLTLMGLAHHPAERMRKNLAWYIADKGETEWASVNVHDFAPIFHVAAAVKAQSEYPPRQDGPGGPSKVAILGRMNPHSRNYDQIIADLQRAIEAQPELWGYKKVPTKRLDKENATIASHRYIPVGDPAHPPFTLNLIGQDEGKIEYPPELIDEDEGSAPIIVRYSDKTYTEFYNIISSMDLILPAFASELYTGYRASAAVASGVISETPILVTPEILEGYTYLGGPAYRLQPPDLDEITTIAHMRSGRDPWEEALHRPLHADEKRPAGSSLPPKDPFYGQTQWAGTPWAQYRADLAERNAGTWLDILHGAKMKIDREAEREMEETMKYSEKKGLNEPETHQAIQGATPPA